MSMSNSNLPTLPLNYLNVASFCSNIACNKDVISYNLAPEIIRNVLFLNKGWRLTKVGLTLLSKNFKPYLSTHENNKILTGKILLNMDNCTQSPWCLSDGTITVFDPILHFEIQMVDGDINAFINMKL